MVQKMHKSYKLLKIASFDSRKFVANLLFWKKNMETMNGTISILSTLAFRYKRIRLSLSKNSDFRRYSMKIQYWMLGDLKLSILKFSKKFSSTIELNSYSFYDLSITH